MKNIEPHVYMMPEEFVKDPSVPARWRVLGVLNGFFLNHKPCWASNEWIAERIGAHKDTVSQAVKELEEMGVVTCRRTKRTRVITKLIGANAYLTSVPTPISDRHQRLTNSVSNSESNISEDETSQEEILIVQDEDKPKRKKSDPTAEQVFRLFKQPYPANWKVNKTQRQAAENLFAERGLTQIRKALDFHRENKDTEFCPQVLTPYDLDSKWDKLKSFKDKHGNS